MPLLAETGLVFSSKYKTTGLGIRLTADSPIKTNIAKAFNSTVRNFLTLGPLVRGSSPLLSGRSAPRWHILRGSAWNIPG
jgi:hypothetical protein